MGFWFLVAGIFTALVVVPVGYVFCFFLLGAENAFLLLLFLGIPGFFLIIVYSMDFYEKCWIASCYREKKPSERVIRVKPEPELQSANQRENTSYEANEDVINISPEPPPKKEKPKREEPTCAAQPEPQQQEPPKPEPPKEKKPQGVVVGIAVDGEEPGAELILEPSLRIRHLYLIGKTRTGKTTLIKNLALQDMAAGHGLCFVDPHGDAAEDLIGCIPQHRIQDVIYFDAASSTCPPFNILRTSFAPAKLTEDIVNVLKMFFGSSWGFRMEHILRYSVLTLLHDSEPRTLKDLRTLLVNENYRAEIIANIQDEALRDFWEMEFANYPSSAVDPIVNKLSSFLVPGSPLLRLFSQKENAIDFSRLMNEQKILIVNLSKGLLSEDPSRLLGGLIVTGIQQAALARADMPPEQRKDFHLYLDEFQNFVVESFESILSEAAKYKLFLTLAHQTLGQVPGYLKHGIFGNVATMIAFQISAEDAATMSREMRRTRVSYRHKYGEEFSPLAPYMEQRKEYWEQKVADYQQKIDALPPLDSQATLEARHTWHADRYRLQQKQDKALRMVSNLTSSNPTLLKEIFPDFEIKQTTFPDVDDFINQQPRHAFCRRERAENVTLFRTLPAPDPNPAIKAAVLRAMNEQPTHSTKSNIIFNPEEFIQSKKESPKEKAKEEKATPAEHPPTQPESQTPANPIAEKLWPEMPKEEPPEAAPQIDPVQAARERRAQKTTPKRSTPKRTPAPQNEDDFSF